MWNDLNMQLRSQIMRMSMENGIYDLNLIKLMYDSNLYLSEGETKKKSSPDYYTIMERVAKENNPIWNRDRITNGLPTLTEDEELTRILNDNSYDYRGYYEKYPQDKSNAETHWTDEFKTVYHPTFSVESKYSGVVDKNYNPQGLIGGTWGDNDEFIRADWLKNEYLTGGWLKRNLKPGYDITKEIIRLMYNREASLADHYNSSDGYTFEDAYKDARNKGLKTFYFDNKYYSTDYKGEHGIQYDKDVESGKAKAFDKAYPGYTNPELRKEKQEELNTYGITNELTRNKSFIQKRALENLDPFGHYNLSHGFNAIVLNRGYNRTKDYEVYLPHDDLLKTYLGYPINTNIDKSGWFWDDKKGSPTRISKYKPTTGNNNNLYYYTFTRNPFGLLANEQDILNIKKEDAILLSKLDNYMEMYNKFGKDRADEIHDSILEKKLNLDFYKLYEPLEDAFVIDDTIPYGKIHRKSFGNLGGLGHFTIYKTPEYNSFYDLWDLNPFDQGPDALTFGLGTPYEYYDRKYNKNEPDIDSLYRNFNLYKSGGSIHIKHPGRLTALKKRTGKSEAELWRTGNAHTRKMITFARNARKWKHDNGGYIDDIVWDLNGYKTHDMDKEPIIGIVGNNGVTSITTYGMKKGNNKPLFIQTEYESGIMYPNENRTFLGNYAIEIPVGHKAQDGRLIIATPQLTDLVRMRYNGYFNAMVNNGIQPKYARLAAELATLLSIAESGWKPNRRHNYGGMKSSSGKVIRYKSNDDYFNSWVKNALNRWPEFYKSLNIEEWDEALNHTSLGLKSQKEYDLYKKTHPNIFIYAPAWENSNYLEKMQGVYPRMSNALDNYDHDVFFGHMQKQDPLNINPEDYVDGKFIRQYGGIVKPFSYGKIPVVRYKKGGSI